MSQPSDRRLARLVAFSLQVAQLRDAEDVIHRALATCLDLIGSGAGFLDLIDEEGMLSVKTVVAGSGVDFELVARHRAVLLGHGEEKVVVLEGQPFLVAPLQVRDARIGTVAVAAPVRRNRIADRRLLRSVANQTAAALDSIGVQRRRRLDRVEAKRAATGERMRRRRTEHARRRVLGQLVAAHEEERRRIADDIHADSLQVLDAAILRLDMLSRDAGDAIRPEQLLDVKASVEGAESRLRTLLFDLRPAAIEGPDGLRWAVQEQLERMSQAIGIAYELDVQLASELGIDARLAIFRIAQEALRNVVRHAHASMLRVRFEDSDGGVLASIQDDGRGFVAVDSLSPAGHFGLTEMAGRAELAGGWFRVASEPGRGTLVESWVPREAGGPDTP